MLLKPISMTQFSISSEDVIEMKNVDIRLLKRFFLCSLPSDSIYFLLGTRELIEVNIFDSYSKIQMFRPVLALLMIVWDGFFKTSYLKKLYSVR
jgi:hypothetical protein